MQCKFWRKKGFLLSNCYCGMEYLLKVTSKLPDGRNCYRGSLIIRISEIMWHYRKVMNLLHNFIWKIKDSKSNWRYSWWLMHVNNAEGLLKKQRQNKIWEQGDWIYLRFKDFFFIGTDIIASYGIGHWLGSGYSLMVF